MREKTNYIPASETTTNPIDAKNKTPKKRRNLLKGITEGTAVGLATLVTYGGIIYGHDPFLAEKIIYDNTFKHNTCPTISHADTDAISNKINHPEKDDHPQEDQITRILRLAKKNNLTTIDYRPYNDPLTKATTTEEASAATNAYTHQYGITFELSYQQEVEDIELGIKPLKDDVSVDVTKFKVGIASLFQSLFVPTKEFIKESGIKKIKIVESTGDFSIGSKKFKHWGKANPITGIVYIPLDEFYELSADELTHEFAHGHFYKKEGAWCAANDNAYKKENHGLKYGKKQKPENFGTVFSDEYGATNMSEEKPMILQGLLLGNSYIRHESAHPLHAKKLRLLAELEDTIPGITDYLSNIYQYKRSDPPARTDKSCHHRTC